MAQASGVYKVTAYKSANSAGIAAAGSGAKVIRRVTSDIDLTKDKYESQELRSDFQRADLRHGVRRSMGNLSGELSPGTYADFMAGILKRDFAAVTAITGLSITIAGSGPTYTITRSAGDWFAGGVKVGMVLRLTAGTFNAANLNANVMVASMTATALTVYVVNGAALVAEGPIASATATVVGKTTFTPQTGHIEKYFSIEEWFPEVPFSGTGFDLRVSSLAMNLPPTGLATIDIGMMGKDVTESGTQRFTTPTAATTTGLTAAVNGLVLFGGVTVAVITGLQINIEASYTGSPVVGSNIIPSLSPGRVLVTGNATVKFENTTWRNAFVNETEVDLVVLLTTSSAKNADFISLVMSRVKLSGAARSDGETEIIQTIPFDALLNIAGGAAVGSELTTLLVQDSAAP